MSQEIYTKGKYIAVVDYDPFPVNPREEYKCENLGVIYYNSSEYTLGDESKSTEEVEEICRDAAIVSFPVYAQIHGDVSLSLTPYDPFDSGRSGTYCVERSRLEKELGKPYDENNSEHVRRIKEIIQGELDAFTSYLNGNVYMVSIYEKTGDIPKDIEDLDIDTLEECGHVKRVGVPVYGLFFGSMKEAAQVIFLLYIKEDTTDKQAEEETSENQADEETCGPC